MSVASATVDQRIVGSVTNRYSDAYLVARTINALGQTVKIAGFIVAGIILFGSLAVGSRGAVGALFAFVGFVVAVLAAAVFFLFGTLLSAQGQILMATLDTAINTSSVISEAERVRLLTLSASEGSTVSTQRAYASTYSASAPQAGPWRCACGQNNPEEQDACLDCGVARALAAT